MRQFRVIALLAVLCVAVLAGTRTVAQTKSSPAVRPSLAGTVKDGKGSVMALATVRVSGPIRRKTETDSGGSYRFADLPPGRYQVKASMVGFKDARSSASVVEGATATVDLVLVLK